MRTLNRPMFRYGGPIKEGVMHGIREPDANGGRAAALVGNPVYPQTGGREHHLWNIPIQIGMAGLRTAGTAAARRAAQEAATRAALSGGATQAAKNVAGKGITGAAPGFWRSAWEGDPIVRSAKWLKNAIMSPTAKGWGQKIVKGSVSPTGLLTTGGISYMFWPDGTPKTKEEIIATSKERRGVSGAPGGGDPDMTYTAPEKELTAAETEAIEAENRIKQMKKYKEIMDIKGMSKDAAYKSLIDASKIIQEGGNLKEQIKSGSLISNLTQAASKRFDKVSDTETALRSLVAKGEIENELNKETKALDKEYKQSAININKKKLAGSTSAEIQSERMIKGDPFQDQGLATLINMKNNGLNAKVYPSKEMKTNDNALDFITEQINIVNSDPATPLFPAGVYVIKDTIIQVDGEGNVTPIPINAIG